MSLKMIYPDIDKRFHRCYYFIKNREINILIIYAPQRDLFGFTQTIVYAHRMIYILPLCIGRNARERMGVNLDGGKGA